MKTELEFPKTLTAAVKYFADPDIAQKFVVQMRWPNGVKCPRCGSDRVSFTAKRRVWTCEDCANRRQFSVKVGTIMEDSPLGLDKWLVGMWLVVSARNGISSYELHRTLGITQKTAWFLGHRIRLALKNGSLEKLSGEVEADETYVGGLSKNMHKDKRAKLTGTGGSDKAIVMGILEREGRVVAGVIDSTAKEVVQAKVHEHVEHGSAVYTDAWRGYNGLASHYAHESVDHQLCYGSGAVHTNNIEGFWNLFKRCIKGTYVHVDRSHLQRYVDEQAYRFNQRGTTDSERFKNMAPSVSGRRLTYRELTSRISPG